jgi:lysozyme family protein
MRNFIDYLWVILKHEGLYVNHPNDPGGATNFGISLRFIKMKGIDVNNDGDINIKDIKDLTVEKASELYYNHFWLPMRLNLIDNELLKLHLFDMGINAGTKTAVRILQRLLEVDDDGIIGKKTVAAINKYGPNIVADYAIARKVYYNKIIERNPKLAVFKKGWYRRVDTTYFKEK